METYAIRLYEQLSANLESHTAEADLVKRYDGCVKSIEETLAELKKYLHIHPFSNREEEIKYFKQLAPLFYSLHFYYIKIYDAELFKRCASLENIRMLFEHGLQEIDLFFFRNNEFCKYYYTRATFLDEQLFVRYDSRIWPFEDLSLVMDAEFSMGSYKVSRILAYEKYRIYLQREILRLDKPDDPALLDLTDRIFKWKGTKAAATEIVDAFVKSKVIEVDGEDADAKDVAYFWKLFLHCDLGNFYEKKRRNLQRKKDNAPFLQSLLQAVKGDSDKK